MTDRQSPFDDIERVFEELNRTVGDVAVPTGLHDVPVDVAKTDTEVVVTADVPGFEKDEITITLSDRVLDIDAERDEDETVEEDATYHRRERRRRRLSRTVRLPAEVDEASARAEYATGVLTVTIQREHDEGDDSRQIDIE